MNIGLVNMDFDYARDFGSSHSTGYERLLYDCMIGDASLFQRADNIESAWRIIQPILDSWREHPEPLPLYACIKDLLRLPERAV